VYLVGRQQGKSCSWIPHSNDHSFERAILKLSEGVEGILERVDAVDYRLDRVVLQEDVHCFKVPFDGGGVP
jgi:hypothetical protein